MRFRLGVAMILAAVFGFELPSAQRQVVAGDPLPGLAAFEFEEFRLGLEDFLEVEDAEEGLGPAVQRHQLRRMPQHTGNRRDRTGDDGSGRNQGSRRHLQGCRSKSRVALSALLGPHPWLSIRHTARGERDRAPSADPALRTAGSRSRQFRTRRSSGWRIHGTRDRESPRTPARAAISDLTARWAGRERGPARNFMNDSKLPKSRVFACSTSAARSYRNENRVITIRSYCSGESSNVRALSEQQLRICDARFPIR